MKRTGILNVRLAGVVAGMGHTDRLVVADAGLPVPPGVPCIDLAVCCGLPGFLDVLRSVAAELKVEAITIAGETRTARTDGLAAEVAALFPGVPVDEVPHEDFKARTANARAVVRTGECSPYANVILHAGVAF